MGVFIELVVAVFKPEAYIILQLGEVVIVAEEDGGVHRLLFCVMFWAQTSIISL